MQYWPNIFNFEFGLYKGPQHTQFSQDYVTINNRKFESVKSKAG